MDTSFNASNVNHSFLIDDINLHENDLTEESKNQFNYHTKILCLFERNRKAIVENDQITRIGRHLLLLRLQNAHTICKRVLNYVAHNIELSSCHLPKFGPIIICGLPRTGSTLLFNLLACDRDCRAPLTIDMTGDCIPPISCSDMDNCKRRIALIERDAQLQERLVGRPDIRVASHPNFPIEEDAYLLEQAGISCPVRFFDLACRSKCDTLFYNETDMDVAYMYHKTFLQMLNSVDKPRSHWLLKAPVHSFYLNVLLRHYPQSALIMTHRNIEDLLPSFYRLTWACDNIYYDVTDHTKHEYMKVGVLHYLDKMIEHIIKFRLDPVDGLHQTKKSIFDVVYNDLIQQPVAVVRRIYDHFNLRWSQEFEMTMFAWLRDNPQGKQGRHTYDLSELGFTCDNVATRYKAYTDLFLRSLNSSRTTDV